MAFLNSFHLVSSWFDFVTHAKKQQRETQQNQQQPASIISVTPIYLQYSERTHSFMLSYWFCNTRYENVSILLFGFFFRIISLNWNRIHIATAAAAFEQQQCSCIRFLHGNRAFLCVFSFSLLISIIQLDSFECNASVQNQPTQTHTLCMHSFVAVNDDSDHNDDWKSKKKTDSQRSLTHIADTVNKIEE